jgi:hypothetical protein
MNTVGFDTTAGDASTAFYGRKPSHFAQRKAVYSTSEGYLLFE